MAVVDSLVGLEQEELNIELTNLVYCNPNLLIAQGDCQPGYLYYGEGRARAHGLAICHAAINSNGQQGDVQFASRDVWRGHDCLRSEVHFDTELQAGTWLPYVQLEKVPEGLGEHELLSWLIDKEFAMHEEKLAWLKGMPDRLKQATQYGEHFYRAQREYELAANKKARGVSPITELSHSEFVRKRFAEIAAKNAAPRVASTPN